MLVATTISHICSIAEKLGDLATDVDRNQFQAEVGHQSRLQPVLACECFCKVVSIEVTFYRSAIEIKFATIGVHSVKPEGVQH